MNPSADKRKIPRMQVDVPACIFLGVSDTGSDVNIKNLSIHGLSFPSRRYFSKGTSFELLFPHQKEDLKRGKIKAVVVRCEALNGFSDGKFRVGAKFLFESKFSAEPNKSPSLREKPSALQPFHAHQPAQIIHQGRLVDLPAQRDNASTLNPPVCTIRVGEIKAEFVQFVQTSQREETIHTFLKIKESRFTALDASTPSNLIFPKEFDTTARKFDKISGPGKTLVKQFTAPS